MMKCNPNNPSPRRPATAAPLIDWLNAQIFSGAYPPGSRIPSVRMLMRRFGLTYSSTLAGVNWLCRQGVLVTCPQSGVFVRHVPESGGRAGRRLIGVLTRVDLLEGEDADRVGLAAECVAAIQRTAEHLGYPLLSIPCGDPAELTAEVLDRRREKLERCAALIVLLELDWRLAAPGFRVPTVGVMQENDFGGEWSLVNPDPLNAAVQATGYFRRRGCRKVWVFSDPRPTYRLRAELFESGWRREGGELAGSTILETDRPELPELPADCGCFFSSDNLAENCIRRYRETRGGRLEQEFCILGVDGKNRLIPEYTHFPSIAVDWGRIGEVAMEEAVGRLENPLRRGRRIYLPGRLSEAQDTNFLQWNGWLKREGGGR